MFQIDKTLTAETTKYYQPKGLGGRWVFPGSRNAGGYATMEDAKVEAELQIANKYQGGLNTAKVLPKDHRASVAILVPLMNRTVSAPVGSPSIGAKVVALKGKLTSHVPGELIVDELVSPALVYVHREGDVNMRHRLVRNEHSGGWFLGSCEVCFIPAS